MSDLAVQRILLNQVTYQKIQLPQGCAPVSVQAVPVQELPIDVEAGIFSNKIAIYFIGPAILNPEYNVDFGAYLVRTGQPLPNELNLFGRRHALIDKVEPPNARYVGTAGNWHLFLGDPK